MNNRQNFNFWTEASHVSDLLVPEYATKAEIHKNDSGYWLNVWWKCGIIAPLTTTETEQALGEYKC